MIGEATDRITFYTQRHVYTAAVLESLSLFTHHLPNPAEMVSVPPPPPSCVFIPDGEVGDKNTHTHLTAKSTEYRYRGEK